jgi:hypothetical protein
LSWKNKSTSWISIAVVDEIPCMDLPILFTIYVTAMGSNPESIKVKVSIPQKCA